LIKSIKSKKETKTLYRNLISRQKKKFDRRVCSLYFRKIFEMQVGITRSLPCRCEPIYSH